MNGYRDRELGGPVALEVMLDASAASVERFAREARLVAALDHPATVRFVATDRTATGEPFLAIGSEAEARNVIAEARESRRRKEAPRALDRHRSVIR